MNRLLKFIVTAVIVAAAAYMFAIHKLLGLFYG